MQRKAKPAIDLHGRQEVDTSDRPQRRSHIICAATLCLVMGLGAAAWWHLSGVDSIRGQRAGIKPAAGAVLPATKQPAVPLTSQTACQALTRMQVCAHRGTHELLATRDLAANMVALCLARACCFDVDAFATSDGHLLVGRPADAEAVLATLNETRLVSAMRLAELHSLGLSTAHFPLLATALQAFHTAVQKSGGVHAHAAPPLLMVELKGEAMSENYISYFAQQAAMARVSPNVALWFPDTIAPRRSDSLLHHMSGVNGNMLSIRGYLDRRTGASDLAPPVGQVRPEDQALYRWIGPSIQLPDTALGNMLATGRPMVAWTVSTEEHLWRAAQTGMSAVITDTPLHMRKLVAELQHKRCSHGQTRL